MTRDAIRTKLGEIAVEASTDPLDWSTVTDDTTIADLGFDSLSVLDLLYDLQEAFGVKIEAKEVLAIDTVGAMVGFLETRVSS